MSNEAADLERVEIPPDSFLRTTGQLWKLFVSGVILPWPAAALGWWFLRRIGPDQSTSEAILSIGGLAATAALIAALLASVRCPQCRARLLVRVIWAPEGLNALTALLTQRACPACGYDPRSRTRR